MSTAVSNNGLNFSQRGSDKDSHMMDSTDDDQVINYSSNSKQSGIQKVTDILKGKLHRSEDSNQCDEQVNENGDNENSDKYLNKSFVYNAENNSMNGDSGNHLEKGVHDLSAMVSRHMLQSHGASPSENGTQVLRGILQNQGEGRTEEDESREAREAEYLRRGSYEIDVDGDSFQSHSPLDMSSEEESDQENNPNRANSPSAGVNSIGIYDHSRLMSRYSSMGSSRNDESGPNSPSKKESPAPVDARRPKRKQYVPQQHGNIDIDADSFDSPRPKCLKTSGGNIGAQIMDLQNQLKDLQRKVVLGSDRDSPINLADDLKLRGKHDDDKLLRGELESFARCIEEASAKCMQNGKSLEKDKFASMLKVEITNSVNQIVDGIVAKYFSYKEKENLKEKNTTTMPSPKEGPGVPPVEPVEPAETGKNKVEQTASPVLNHANNNNNEIKPQFTPSSPSSHRVKEHKLPHFPPHKPSKTKITDKIVNPFFDVHPHKNFAEMLKMQSFYPPNPFLPLHGHMMPHHHHPHLFPDIRNVFAKDLMKPEPEQTEPISLVVNTPKKKRTKVTDTRLSPRAARALLHEPVPVQQPTSMENHTGADHMPPHPHLPHHPHHHPHLTLPHTPQEAFSHSPFLPSSLPTSVAIPNPSLQQSEFMSMYNHGEHSPFAEVKTSSANSHSPVRDHISPNMSHGGDSFHHRFKHDMDSYDSQDTPDGYHLTSTLTPMHLRKAKLMFFFLRYPSSSILKIYFPDVKFNKNNTAQLVKWFSNFREFYYIQMEKYARQAIAEGVTNPEDLIVTTDSELYRVLNLHYNRNNQLEVPENFRIVVQATLREFFKSISAKKDTEQSWKKTIYKVIARLDDSVPDFFKSPNWMEQLNDS